MKICGHTSNESTILQDIFELRTTSFSLSSISSEVSFLLSGVFLSSMSQ